MPFKTAFAHEQRAQRVQRGGDGQHGKCEEQPCSGSREQTQDEAQKGLPLMFWAVTGGFNIAIGFAKLFLRK